MVDLSRLMQDAAILEVIEQSADECRTLSAQNSYQAMRIEELERELSEARAEIARLKGHWFADDNPAETDYSIEFHAYRASYPEK